ncbi:serine/threonine-protein kinase ste20-like-related [Anaeramoeba ignava]|uniref:Serine/threonine-protein kinase ste20-like-related n=1 Tax=Anaeramoeba ignava TaxID=1746090 RepID=A0A9Q0R6F0_ANAIG|nr:serine/threonine-protein kinase ste20-like-related [Anaeramoeba ignava]
MESNQRYPTNRKDYELLTKIGSGATSTVWKAKCIPLNEIIAIKIVDLEEIGVEMEELSQEIQNWKLCVHPNIVQFHVSFVYETSIWLVMDFVSEGGLKLKSN